MGSEGLRELTNQTAPPSSELIFIQNAEMLNHSNRIDPGVSACVVFLFSSFRCVLNFDISVKQGQGCHKEDRSRASLMVKKWYFKRRL